MAGPPKRNVVVASLREIDPAYNVIFTPYLWGCLKSYAMKFDDLARSYAFAEPIWRQQNTEAMLAEIDHPDVMAFSTYVWNHRNTQKLARAVKERYPDCRIVFGGPHVPNDAREYLAEHPWIDVCVHGEGERTFAEILRACLAERPDLAEVSGVSYLRDGQVVTTPRNRRMEPDDYPSPYATGGFESFMEKIRRTHPRAHVMAVLETNRGCPHGCTFCDWGMDTLSKLKVVPEPVIFAEMDWLAQNGVDSVVLADANFGILRRDVDLLKRLADLKRRYGGPRGLFIAGMDKVHIDRVLGINAIIKEHDWDMTGTSVNVSLQSVSQATLDAIHRRNLPFERYRRQAALYTEAGYDMVIELILPLPGETLASFKEGFSELASWEAVTKIRLYPALVLPNAPMGHPAYREKWGIRTAPAPFEGRRSPDAGDAELEYEERVVATSTMSESEHADAKAFASLVFALEIGRLLRPLRKYVAKKSGTAVHDFYDRLAAWQRAKKGVLASALVAVRDAVADHTWGVDGTWFSSIETSTGLRMHTSKAIAFEVLTHPARFVEELREFCSSEFSVVDPLELDELLGFVRDTWIGPDFRTRDGRCVFEYERDWIAFFADDRAMEPAARRTRVEYAAPAFARDEGYDEQVWLERVLVASKVYEQTFCHALPKPRKRAAVVVGDSFGDEPSACS